MATAGTEDQINAHPTKTFFVEMLTRDINLEQALLDLVDNSIDGAKAIRGTVAHPFDGLEVNITFDKNHFSIVDNCGGFSKQVAREYAFRFGRPNGTPSTPHSIGQFGVGMKRALFKFGHHFTVRSATATEAWSVDVDVPSWEASDGWHFPWAEFEADAKISVARPGVEIKVTELRTEVGWRFSTSNFQNSIVGLIKSKHRQFISDGLRITVNGVSIDATSLFLLVGSEHAFRPGVDNFPINDDGAVSVSVRILVGVGPSLPKEAGWYVVCNGRVVLEADRRDVTGWGVVEDESNSVVIPSFHNQFARFRGIVNFDSDDSARVPWNTTKTDINQDSTVWQEAFGRMVEMMRPVISFLNELDTDIEEFTKDGSALQEMVAKSNLVKAETLTVRAEFSAPARGTIRRSIPTIKIQFSKPIEQVDYLMHELSLNTAKAVGERCFEMSYERLGGK